jgi:hypothetical protein
MVNLDKIHIATAITNNIFKDIVKVMASSFVRNNPNLQLHVYCLNFDNESYTTYRGSFNLPGVVLHQVEYHNQYTDPNATGVDRYRSILDATSVKFKLANDNTQDYFMWVDADTFFTKPLAGIEKFIRYDAVYGVPRTKFLPVSKLTFNAGVLLFPKSVTDGILAKYTAYCQKVQSIDPKLLGWSDEYFIRDELPVKGILPMIYNATPRNYSRDAVINHIVGKAVPWTVPVKVLANAKTPHKTIKSLCDSWMAEYEIAKPLLDPEFIKQVEA